ncbi:MAG: nicotinate-nucleotide--dimethylbenzimidazole phosphoribosyltransferase [Lachnospiraceae bacterium]|nr:nicotinate-nucleotide--dimethylbenzimidazole phosphoribosyltransferase [Lachnospiraceae bacterium]
MTKDELLKIRIERPDQNIHDETKRNLDRLAKPIDGLGDFEEAIAKIAAIQGTAWPHVGNKALVIFCADNGIVEEGVSQTDQSVTASVAALMGENKSSVGIMTGDYPCTIYTVDVGIDTEEKLDGVIDMRVSRGTANFLKAPAMTEDACLQAIENGMEMAMRCHKAGHDLLATGEMGIGNTTTSTALYCALTGELPVSVAGRGAGLSDAGLARKIRVIDRAIRLHTLDTALVSEKPAEYAFRALCCVGGLDIAALAGFMIGAATLKIPVVVDGLISAVAAMTAAMLVPGTENVLLASHEGREHGVHGALRRLGLTSFIRGNLALGEGTGAVMLFPLLDMALRLYDSGTKFADTSIGQYERYDR